jgi:hypothetical protein
MHAIQVCVSTAFATLVTVCEPVLIDEIRNDL